MNGWYRAKWRLDGSDIVINLDTVNAILNHNGYAVFVVNNDKCTSIETTEKYEDVLRKLFGPDDPEKGEDDGRSEDPSGFGGMLPM